MLHTAVFGVDYDPPVGWSVKDLGGCKTIEDCLALVPDDRLKSFAQKIGELPNQPNQGEEDEEEEDAHATTRKLYFGENAMGMLVMV